MGNEEVDLVTVSKPQEKRSLLQKYDIPVEHLSYEYVTNSTNVKELERIVLILRSGEEGIFPDLISHAEKCLSNLNPKSKVLRVEEPVITREMLEPDDRQLIDKEIAEWMSEMQGREKDLEEGKALALSLPVQQPEIRQTPETTSKKTPNLLKKGDKKKESISACDYAGWDKFDADAELDRMDLQEERKQVAAKKAQKEYREKFEKAKKQTRESMVNKLTLTATELSVLAEQERNIGNEAYRAGDYEEALIRYNSSIGINCTVNAYNNRSITNIKLRRYQDAVNDCNVVLSMEHENVIALMRRGLALEKLDKKSEALVDYQTILQLEPNNKIAINAVNKLRKPSDSKKVRMKIEEEEESKREEKSGEGLSNDFLKNTASEICFCDRAPGFSQSPKPPPHYKSSYCLSPRRGPKIGNSVLGQSRSHHSYFSDVKLNPNLRNDSPKLIIEELPSGDHSIPKKEKTNFPKRETVCKKNGEIGGRDENPEIIKNEVSKKIEMQNREEKEEEEGRSEGKKLDSVPKPKNFSVSKNQKKISVASKYERQPVVLRAEEKSDNFAAVESPYEFFHVWQSLKNDLDLSSRGKLLRSVAPEDLDTVIGNKLDGSMLSVMLQCLDRHFSSVEDYSLMNRFMIALPKLRRFSIVRLFMDSEDKKVIQRILNFLEPQISSDDAKALRQAYDF